jgi:aryl-alcohol dehydrogenase-like predicted oxidoreductase/predicted kinase
MRLSTDDARGDGLAVLQAALDAGVTLLDTADAYCLDDTEVGHNEHLVARAVSGRTGVRVVTKGGLTRPGGAWVPNGRAKHLAAAARASRDRLGAIDVYLLHAIDPRTPLATSVRALAKLRDDGIARAIGLSNVSLTQLEEAEAITRIDAVEVELSPFKLDAIRGGLVAACAARNIELYAHRPLGGPAGARRLTKDPVVAAIAQRLDATPHEVALAWLRSLSPAIIPIPGATRIATAIARAIELDADACAALAAQFLAVGRSAPHVPEHHDEVRERGSAYVSEVVLVTGMPGAGKSTIATDYVARGYVRLNRDERGGSLLDLARALDDALAGGATHVVLDNTYPTRASRAPVIEIAHRHGLAARCVVVDIAIEDAQRNAVGRMLAQHGRLLEPAELARAGNVGPGAQFRWRREAEPPRADEGFDAIDERPFARAPAAGGAPALLIELDAVVWVGRPRSPEKVQLKDGARDALLAWSRTHAIAGTSWMPGVTREAFAALIDRLSELVGTSVRAAHCAHPAGPPVCWCRKPLPGLALWLAHAHGLAHALCVGSGAADKGFARRAGVPFHDLSAGWPSPQDR